MKSQAVRSHLSRLPAGIAAATLLLLAACTGGGAGTEESPETPPSSGGNYNGPPPATDDVQRFKLNVWDNLVGADRCGACHGNTGLMQEPRFVRTDDVNLAYDAARTVANLAEPEASRMVEKVAGGHNCWLGNEPGQLEACAETLTRYIAGWAGISGGGGANEVQLEPPVVREPGESRTFPSSSAGFASTVWPLLTEYCSRCHSDTAPNAQSPYFASADVDVAYLAAQSKINLDNIPLSRLIVRLREESHNCWDNCTNNANEMEAAITAFVNGIEPTQVDPSLIISRSLRLVDGLVASSGGRYEANVIGLYEFKTGRDLVAYDTSGVEPAAHLDLRGSVEWVGGWGLQFTGGKAQASTLSSKKYHDRIKSTGEYSIEAWVAPANVTQDGPARIIAYSGGSGANNFTLGQTLYNYDFLMRHSNTGADGNPALSTADADERLQATLQHVVVTYDPVRGRRLYVNGVYTGDTDGTAPGNLNDWDDTFALVLGNDVSNDQKWEGIIKLVAIHERALTEAQIQQNFAVGVGERYYLLFGISHLLDNPACYLGTPAVAQCYIAYEVSRYDSYGYLFKDPFFVSLNAAASFAEVPLKGIRIGINGREAGVGQSYAKLNTPINAVRQTLSPLGTIIGLEKGPNSDEFFLSFEQIGSRSRNYVEADPPPAAAPTDGSPEPAIGVRTFDEINESLSSITTVPATNADVAAVFNQIRQAMPSVETITAFNAAQQMAITQLSIAYCSELVDDTSKRASYFPGVNFGAGPATALDATGRNNVINPLMAQVMASGVASQPDLADVRTEMNALITKLAASGSNTAARTVTIVKSVCAATVGNAAMLVQ